MAKLIVESKGSMLDRIAAVLARARGAYSIVLCTQDELYAFRDPWGVRPLCLGALSEGGYVVASESCALGTVGAQYVREIERGEIVRITASGLESRRMPVEDAQQALCMFEYIYFARPDSRLNDRSVYMARYEMGRQLAREHPVDADVVMAVPDSAVAGGIGYAAESGLPYIEGLIKNRYIGRTFISPDQNMRARGVHLKFNPVVENLRDQRVIVVDDSIVRGTTTPRIVALLREAGAREVHLRITSPPIKHPCYLGVDMATYDELIAANYTVDEIRRKTGADSLGYLSLDGLIGAVGRKREEMCLGCLVGDYPNVPSTHARTNSTSPTPSRVILSLSKDNPFAKTVWFKGLACGALQSKWVTLGKRIAALRRALGWSQNELARRAEVNHPTLFKIEADQRLNPSVSVIVRIARALGTTAESALRYRARGVALLGRGQQVGDDPRNPPDRTKAQRSGTRSRHGVRHRRARASRRASPRSVA